MGVPEGHKWPQTLQRHSCAVAVSYTKLWNPFGISGHSVVFDLFKLGNVLGQSEPDRLHLNHSIIRLLMLNIKNKKSQSSFLASVLETSRQEMQEQFWRTPKPSLASECSGSKYDLGCFYLASSDMPIAKSSCLLSERHRTLWLRPTVLSAALFTGTFLCTIQDASY